MMREDDKRFYELSAKQAEYRIRRRRLAKQPERVYDRDVNLKRDLEIPQSVEEKYENDLLLKAIFKKNK